MLTKSMKIVNNEILLHDESLQTYAKTYGTPLMIYDEDAILDKIHSIQKAFHSRSLKTQIVYASKAFLCKYVASLMSQQGLWIDVVSLGEATIALNAGVKPEHMIFHGNNKSVEELKFIVNHSFRYVVVDNIKELKLLVEYAKIANTKVQTLFRMNPGIEAHTHEYIQTSLLSSKFGESIFDQELIDEVMNVYQTNSEVVLNGFHIHIGSQIRSAEPYLKAAEVMMQFSKKIKEAYHIDINTLNFGGGFGIKYLESDDDYNLEDVLERLIRTLESINQTLQVGIKQVLIEPGRSIVGPNGVTLYEASQIKKTFGGKQYCLIDGGMADNIRPALYQAKYTIKVVNQVESTNQVLVDVVGKCCESGDIIARDIMLPANINNDILIVFSTGAYGYSMSSNYNGLLRPEVLFVRKDKVNVAIKRETYDYIEK